MSHSTSRVLKAGQLSELQSYDGGLQNAGGSMEKLINATSTQKMVDVVNVTSASANIDTSNLSVPANCIVTGVGAMVTTELVSNLAANVGVSFGIGSAGNTHFTGTLDADSLEATTTNVSASLCNSNIAHIRNGDTATLAMEVGKTLMTGSCDVFGRIKASTGGFATGQAAFFVEYMSLDSGSVG